MDLTTATPVEIDTVLAEIYGRRYRAQAERDTHWDYVKDYAAHILGMTGFRSPKPNGEQVKEVLGLARQAREEGQTLVGYQSPMLGQYDKYVAAQERVKATHVEEEPLQAEFDRRGGWTRAFLVNNSNGHVHSSMACSTCFITTQYAWMVAYSGKDEQEIVEAAGERACTVCYPSAPVSVLSRPTRMFTPDEEEAARKREERAAAKAAKDAEKVIVEEFPRDYVRPGQVATHRKEFKTLRAATQAASKARADVIAWNYGGRPHPSTPVWEQMAEVIEQAIAEKTGTPLAEVKADIAKRAAASAKRRG